MSALEERIKEAFDEIKMPQGLKAATLEMIEENTSAQATSAQAQTGPKNLSALAVAKTDDAAQSGEGGNIVPFVTATAPKDRPRRAKSLFTRKMGLALAACMLLCVIGFGGFSAYAKETAVVGIELNPSIELGINRFDIVVGARALNADGEYVLSSVSVTGKNYEAALALITESDAFRSFIDEDSFVDVYVVCDDDGQSATLVSTGQRNISSLPCAGTSNRISSETKNAAAGYDMGVARYEAARVLVSLDSSLTLEDCTSMSMRELRARIAEIDPENTYATTPGNGAGGNHGNSQGSGSHQGRGGGSGTGQGLGMGSGRGR